MKLTKKEQKIAAEFSRLLPGVTISPVRRGNEQEVNSAHYSVPAENKYLQNSEYFYKGDLTFVHFTNLFALQSIITDRVVRLYNLHNLSDPREYSFAGNLIMFNHENKPDAKENIFLLSMCKTDLINDSSEIEFNMWRLYGSNGSGIALIFNFNECHPLKWKDYYLSEVHYGAKSKTRLKEINELLKKLENDHPHVSVDLGQIVCFHKAKLFKLEKEIRLLFDCREKRFIRASNYYDKNGEKTAPSIRTDIFKSSHGKKLIKYLELPIYHSGFEPVFDDNRIPIPRIEKIILGFQYKDNYESIKNELAQLCELRLGYSPIIEKSRLTKWYHEPE